MLNQLPIAPPNRIGWPWTDEASQLNKKKVNNPPTSNPPLPRITVVTPSYNQGQFLEETIRSVLLQGYPNLEYIIIDGGSDDDSVDVIKKYESWISCWVSEPDRGQSHAINKGANKATGDILSWLNSDDLLYPGALNAIGRAFTQYPDVGMIYGSGSKIYTHGETLKRIPYIPYDANRIRTRYYMLQQSSFMLREAFINVGGVDESIYYFMDWDLTIRISMQYSIYAIPDDIGMFRIQPNAKTQTSGWERFEEIAAIGKKYNGVLDRNYLTYMPHFACYQIANLFGKNSRTSFRLLHKGFSQVFDMVYGADSYMMHP